MTTATGGSTTTAVDTKLTGKDIDDTDYEEGFIHVISASGAAPEDEFHRISANADNGTSITFTVDTAFTAAIASGDTFGYVRPTYPLLIVIEQINAGLKMIGFVDLVDKTTLDTVAAQTEYAWALAWKHAKPWRIDVQTNTGDSNQNQWQEIHNWEVEPAAGGSTGLIIFWNQPQSSRDMRIWYQSQHPRVSAYSDVIHESIHPELATKACIAKLAEWNLRRSGVEDPDARQFKNDSIREYDIAVATYPRWRPKKSAKGLTVD